MNSSEKTHTCEDFWTYVSWTSSPIVKNITGLTKLATQTKINESDSFGANRKWTESSFFRIAGVLNYLYSLSVYGKVLSFVPTWTHSVHGSTVNWLFSLTHFNPMRHFDTPWKTLKNWEQMNHYDQLPSVQNHVGQFQVSMHNVHLKIKISLYNNRYSRRRHKSLKK